MEDCDEDVNEIICNERLKTRKIPAQNIVSRILNRERGIHKHTINYVNIMRGFYTNICPNLTIVNVEKPMGYLRKFSPDGKYLISFSYDQLSLEIFNFKGVVTAGTLLKDFRFEVVGNAYAGDTHKIRSQIFDHLFKLRHRVKIPPCNKQLNRECSLFTNDNNYVIIGAAGFLSDDFRPNYYELYNTSEAITPTMKFQLEDYSIYLVDLRVGRITSTIDFKFDKIYLAHNQGIYLYDYQLAILSVQQQTIHIYKIIDGNFHKVLNIGRFCSMDDELLYQSVYPPREPPNRNVRDKQLNSLKHRCLVFLYRRAKQKSDNANNQYELRKFYQYFEQFVQLRMWKMQLLDDDHILIKYATEEMITLKSSEPNNQPCYFVIYNIWKCEVLEISDNSSTDLLQLFENHTDLFRNSRLNFDVQAPCTANNNLYLKLQHARFKQSIISARGGGFTEATRRMLSQLPINAQSHNNSPYLDLSLYGYDDKYISIIERPRTCGEYPIRFFARDSGLLKFRIYPGLQDRNAPTTRRLVAFTFHPTEPFAISIQRINNDYVVNFHIWNGGMSIDYF